MLVPALDTQTGGNDGHITTPWFARSKWNQLTHRIAQKYHWPATLWW